MSAVALPAPGLPPCPPLLSGVVYNTLLNHAPEWEALGETAHQPPHKAPAQRPVLALRPRNTLAGPGARVVVPAGEAALQVGVSLGLVIGQPACAVPAERAAEVVAGYCVVADVWVPHPSHYRPAVRQHARDGFCPLGPVVSASAVAEPDALRTEVWVDGVCMQQASTAQRLRPVARLIADVTDFMTLQPGDVLMLGAATPAPLVRAGQRVSLRIDGLPALALELVAGEGR
ncbi:fumarylacetoacetate hydrolase family protein [Ideonella livida]|uniref:2-hydroxyhepta-2,4-diene-1,7-dioate isomerase n=1 Tax=Ideonella livida TaxID=2707176 RepID=A0A7C9TNF7_9BURK|nr:fumarylacetoacetate hydrolase family protein [Ideonella livida]NDY92486.1 2-hydroxyhepta-2,4-diene-1,7-dioate isomerase [Ideonella livida]